ncbi:MAG: sugar-binding protein [Austwickia sp.]|nr:sugar-binding protein [Austwickia sp.]
MRRTITTAVAIAAVSTLALTGCGRSDSGSGSTASTGNSGTSKSGGFAQYCFIGVAEQQNQIQTMVTKGAKVVVIGALDGGQLASQAKAAKDAGATVIAYDRLILNTPNVDYYVAFDNRKVGQLQGQALLDGLKAKKPNGPYNIELLAGSPDDSNAKVFFDGAMDVLKPKIDDGTLKVVSGQKEFTQVVTQDWKAENAQKRMDNLLTANYSSATLDGVLSPNDTLARAVLTSVKAAGKPAPVVTGQDSEVESVKSIVSSDPYAQYSTINKDTRKLVAATLDMIKALQKGQKPTVTDEKQYNNGVKVVAANLLEPVIVTKANAKEAYKDDPTLSKITG